MLVMQNSPQRQYSSFQGQYIFPQACDPPVTTRQPWRSACTNAASTSGFGCRVLGMEFRPMNQVVK